MEQGGVINLGNRESLRATYDRFYRPLCFFCRRWVDDMGEAEDIVQDVFVAIAERRMSFDSMSALGAYLYRAVSNSGRNRQVIGDIHKRHRALIAERMTAVEEQEFAAAAIEDDLMWEIMASIDALPRECGRIFRMSYIDKLDIENIAGQLGISPHTVKSQRARAKKLLRERLKGLYPLCVLLFSVY